MLELSARAMLLPIPKAPLTTSREIMEMYLISSISNYKIALILTYIIFIKSRLILDMLLQILRHGFWEMIRTVVKVRLPPEDLVQLQEDARSRLVVGEVVLLNAGAPGADVDVANLARAGGEVEVTVEDVLACSAGLVSLVG